MAQSPCTSSSSFSNEPGADYIVNLNVGGRIFATSCNTLSWIPDSFFTSLLSGRMNSVRDASGAIFIDRDPDVFRVILNYLRTKQVDLGGLKVATLKHEALFFGLTPLIRRLTLCEELSSTSCGSVYFCGMIPPPDMPLENLPNEKSRSPMYSESNDSKKPSGGSPRHRVHSKKQSSDMSKYIKNELTELAKSKSLPDRDTEPLKVRMIRAHICSIVVAYSYFVCVYRVTEWNTYILLWKSPRTRTYVTHIAVNTKIAATVAERLVAVAFADDTIGLWHIDDEGKTEKKGLFSMNVSIDNLFFVGTQMVALSKTGKVGIWHSATQNWQAQDVQPISCYDTAGSSLILGCANGSMNHIDMQKFPLRMKDNDLLVTELFRDPNGDTITSLSVFLTPKTSACGNWIEIAYGTSNGVVNLILQHPETAGHQPVLFQSYNIHNSPVVRVSLNTAHLISVCSEYNHVRSWNVTRFRGMINTQPGTVPLASFKVLTLDSTDETTDKQYNHPGPYGDQDSEQVLVQRVIPNAQKLFVRLASTGERICTVDSVEDSPITAFCVHELDGQKLGSRLRKHLFCGNGNGSVQVWDLTSALDQFHLKNGSNPGHQVNPPAAANQADLIKNQFAQSPRSLISLSNYSGGPTPQELLDVIDDNDICCSTPALSRCPSTAFQ
ncbi:unnamed protein product [Caenorhabditis nigoni]|uniref:BTB domain-containing protein n=1 Tax=Caenorhabditis nigoni TaxID=1611254 RepID=A0A2G5T6M5_9PELO|nr:hypothetical protein B9Z55_016680 [Caenorhabditis nigoni]